MPTKTKSAVLVGPKQIEIKEFALPEIGSDEGLLRVEVCGVCGSDWPPYLRGAFGRYKLPLILGHETIGRIEQIGSDAAKAWSVKVGDRVTLEEPLPCGACDACRAGWYFKCRSKGGRSGATTYGATALDVSPGLWGGYGEYVFLDSHAIVHKMSTSVSLEIAPLFIPISNGICWTQELGEVKVGSTVVIQGPGQHGLGCVIGAKEAGAGCIIVIGLSRDAERLAIAKDLGADYTLCTDDDNLVDKVTEITGGRMASVVINVASGAPESFETGLDLAGTDAIIVKIGSAGRPTTSFNPDKLAGKTIKSGGGRDRRSVKSAIRIIESGAYPLENLCTHTYGIDETDRALRTLGWEGDPNPIHISIVTA